MPTRRSGALLDRLVPTDRSEAAERSLSAIYGRAAFPFHTDAAHHPAPPRFVLLRCASGGASPTLIIDSRTLRLSSAEGRLLRREQWLVSGGKGRTFYSSILATRDGRDIIRWDPGCMGAPAGTNLVGARRLIEALERAQAVRVSWREDDIVVVDNWRMLHARPPAGVEDRERVIERIMVA